MSDTLSTCFQVEVIAEVLQGTDTSHTIRVEGKHTSDKTMEVRSYCELPPEVRVTVNTLNDTRNLWFGQDDEVVLVPGRQRINGWKVWSP